MKTPDFMSYEKYKKKKQKEDPKNTLIIAIGTFFMALLLFTAIAKSLSPDVDVTIGDDSGTDAKESGLGVKRFIDERLKLIQMEDNSAGVSIKKTDAEQSQYNSDSDILPQEQEEKLTFPKKKNDNFDEGTNVQNDSDDEFVRQSIQPPRPKPKDVRTPFENPKMSKVYVGRYATVEQARVAQDILVDSGLNITPFIKNLGSYYTLQVGSYSNKATAEGLASELQRNNFPARVIQE